MAWTRREWMIGSAGLGALALLPGWASARTDGERRLVLLLLRGALDGMGAVPPHGDRHYARVRGELALDPPGRSERAALDLDGFFGLHPALAPIHPWFARGELVPVHAVGLPYRGRSHFDAQNVLENGHAEPFASDSGWLNRAVGALGGEVALPVAMSRTVPLVLRGDAPVSSADPLRDWMPADDFVDRVADLYATDPYLGPALEAAIQTQDQLTRTREEPKGRRPGRPDLSAAARDVGAWMAAEDGPRIAVAEAGGWDTHTGQEGGLNRLLSGLAGTLNGLRTGLGEAWAHTAVVVVTEFGRTAHPNGSRGSDHGTGGVALIAGGGLGGDRVLGDWPGLGPGALYEDRDLRPTTDLRAVFKGALVHHLGLDEGAVEDRVFPDSQRVRPLWPGLG